MDGRGKSSTATGYAIAESMCSSLAGIVGCSSLPVHIGAAAGSNPNLFVNLLQQLAPP